MNKPQNDEKTQNGNVQSPPRNRRDLFHPGTFEEFVLWFALPRFEKLKMGLEWQEDFARHHSISDKALSRWKKRPEFYPKVEELRRAWTKNRTSDVMESIYRAALKGNPLSQKLWYQIFEGWSEKTEVLHTKKIELNVNDIRFIIEQFPEQQKEKYYGYIREIIDAAESLRNAGQLENRDISYEESEVTVLDPTDHDAQDIPGTRTDGLAESDQISVRPYLVRKTSASDNQGTARWWKEQTTGDTRI